ncbi:DUF2470 domain-containing protein [Ignatzschineria larvae DSM 13226]|uniref:DUF2470 domain-containing protein n=1 Tax=Ignatzschineria larvae DSM 13226 TaxID=1111732 RepID=A0ABZ3C0E2_9GAMM
MSHPHDQVTKNNLTQSYSKQDAAKDSQKQLLSNFNGVLATIMRDTLDIGGYPLGSVVPFCLNERNEIVLLIADIAQHTKNVKENGKASLTLHNDDQDNIQKGWRLTILGDVEPATEEEISFLARRYERFYPESTLYYKVHNFAFYLPKPKKARYINGFGEIHWVDYSTILAPTIFDEKSESEMLDHMNADHHDALVLYLNTQTTVTKPEKVRMVQVDQYGFTVAHDEAFFRFTFEQEATSAMDVRKFLVEMVQKIRTKAA